MMVEFEEIQTLLPHRGQMALLSHVVQFDPPLLEVRARITENGLFSDQAGNLSAWIGIELMAQGAAAFAGLLARREGGTPPEAGYLLGTRKFTSQSEVFLKNTELRVMAEMIFRGDTGLCAFDCKLLQDDTVLASATINVYEPPPGTLKIQAQTN